jgi:hypothetical protein
MWRGVRRDPNYFLDSGPREWTQDASHQKSALTDHYLQVPVGYNRKIKKYSHILLIYLFIYYILFIYFFFFNFLACIKIRIFLDFNSEYHFRVKNLVR